MSAASKQTDTLPSQSIGTDREVILSLPQLNYIGKVISLAVCESHSGLASEVGNIKTWQERHIDIDHKEIWKNIDGLRNRLPLWATFLIAFLSSIATWGLTH